MLNKFYYYYFHEENKTFCGHATVKVLSLANKDNEITELSSHKKGHHNKKYQAIPTEWISFL